MSHFTVLNKHKKLIDHERENLIFDRKVGPKVDKHGRKLKMTYLAVYKHFDDLPDTSLSFTNL